MYYNEKTEDWLLCYKIVFLNNVLNKLKISFPQSYLAIFKIILGEYVSKSRLCIRFSFPRPFQKFMSKFTCPTEF